MKINLSTLSFDIRLLFFEWSRFMIENARSEATLLAEVQSNRSARAAR
jgi:hypothetical protein